MVDYEWDVEIQASEPTDILEEGEVIDHHFCGSLAEARTVAGRPPEPGTRHAIVLVRDDNDGRSWAYLKDDGTLPDFFIDGNMRAAYRVPQKFQRAALLAK